MQTKTHLRQGKPLQGFGVNSIAYQCPYTGGGAVYLAQTIMQEFIDSLSFDDEDICMQQGIYRAGVVSDSATVGYGCMLLPNPTKNLLTIHFVASVNSKITTTVYDMYGRLLQTIAHTKPGNAIVLDVSNLANGAYKIKITGITGTSLIKNFVVCK